jgi:UDP-glucose 4-epimerase
MNCLILGGTGLLGGALLSALAQQGHSIKAISRNPPLSEENACLPCVEWIYGDIADEKLMAQAVAGVDIIFHLLSTVGPELSNRDPIYDVNSNLINTLHLLELARHNKVKKIIFSSSGGAIYGFSKELPLIETHPTEPLSSYGIVKLAIEKYLQCYYLHYGLDYCVLRISNAYGGFLPLNKDYGAVNVFLEKILSNQLIEIWGDGNIVRDYIICDDVARAMLQAMDHHGNEKTFNIGGGTGTSLNKLIELIESITAKKARVNYLPARKLDVPINILDISLAKKHLNWAPKIDLAHGIELTLDRWQQKESL